MPKRERYQGRSDPLSNPRVLMGLIRVASPQYASAMDEMSQSVATMTSQFKTCKKSAGRDLPFGDKAFTASFDHDVRERYAAPANRMRRFADMYLAVEDGKTIERLVRMLLELVQRDSSILDSDMFYTGEAGTPETKEELLSRSDICLDSFLLGLWHFIILHRPDNSVGTETLQLLYKPREDEHQIPSLAEWFGKYVTRPLDITRWRRDDDAHESADDDAGSEDESVEPEIVEENPKGGNGAPTIFNQWVNNGNGTQAAYIENLTLNIN